MFWYHVISIVLIPLINNLDIKKWIYIAIIYYTKAPDLVCANNFTYIKATRNWCCHSFKLLHRFKFLYCKGNYRRMRLHIPITASISVSVFIVYLLLQNSFYQDSNVKNNPPDPRHASHGLIGVSYRRISQITRLCTVPICWPCTTKSPSFTSTRAKV